MNTLAILYVLVFGITIGGCLTWWICDRFIVSPLQEFIKKSNIAVDTVRKYVQEANELLDASNKEKLRCLLCRECAEEEDSEDDEDSDDYAPEEEEPPTLLIVAPGIMNTDDAGNKVNRVINFGEPQ